jgi:hypothetical protein
MADPSVTTVFSRIEEERKHLRIHPNETLSHHQQQQQSQQQQQQKKNEKCNLQ